ncbi:MAG: VWA domain-containing protein [Fluviicola sp.]
MRYLLILITIFCGLQLQAQVTFDKTKHDFGDLEAYDFRFVDILLTNEGEKQEWILSVKKPNEVVYINSGSIIEKDSTVILRLQVNPPGKGRFSYNVEVFTSDRNEPVRIKLTGNLKQTDQNDVSSFTSCPNFNERPGGKDPNAFDLTVVTIDKETRETLSKSTVSLIQNGQDVWTDQTDRNGKIKKEATLGLSYFYATHEGYFPEELGAYINFKRNYFVLELEQRPEEVVPDPDPMPDTTIIAENPPEIIVEVEDHIETDTTTYVAEVPPSFEELDDDDFTSQNFNPINVVFVLDISSSMKDADKIELMKYSLFQLTDMLRPQDKMSIVTYSTNTSVLLPPTSGADKSDIKEKVEKLKASGFTAGGKGIKLGYKQASRAKIEGGVNHVIIITDGAFNRDSDDYKRYVRKYARRGIHLSVVGIKNKERDREQMEYAAQLGKGNYVPIFGLSDAKRNLKQEIRVLTYKH